MRTLAKTPPAPMAKEWKRAPKIGSRHLTYDCEVISNPITKCIFAVSLKTDPVQYAIEEMHQYNNNDNVADWETHKVPKLSNFCGTKIDKICLAINGRENILYILNQQGAVAILKLNQQMKPLEWDIKIKLSKSSRIRTLNSIVVDNTIHIINMNDDNIEHIVYNCKNNNFVVLNNNLKHILNATQIEGAQLISASNNAILMIGGFQITEFHEYNFINEKWLKLKIKIPHPMYNFGCTTIINNQYIAIFGGCKKREDDHLNWYYTNEIWIYSVYDKTFKKSNVKCPKQDEYKAFTVNNKKRDEIITFGFIRDQWRQCSLNIQLLPPNYLIRLINSYYLNEWIHLFTNYRRKSHWMIDSFKLVAT